MFSFSSPIFNSLSPNTEKDDMFLALKLIFEPWKWKRGEAAGKLEDKFKNYLGLKYGFAFASGRSAFLAILEGLRFEPGSEILVQAFTCNAAVSPILKAGLKPVFVDIKKHSLNIDVFDLERKITAKARAILVQHTFGLPADIQEIKAIASKRNLILIEDCAHSLGASVSGKKTGSFSDASFFSLGRDKVISSVFGGVALTNNRDLAKAMENFQKKLKYPNFSWVLQQLLHPVLCNFIIMPLYGLFGIGKYVLIFFQKTRILSKAVTSGEKKGKWASVFPRKMPNGLALLGLRQFSKLERFNLHRSQIAEIYDRELGGLNLMLPLKKEGRIYMRYPLIFKNSRTDDILKKLRRKKIFIDDGWRDKAIMPPDTDQAKAGYRSGSCVSAEEAAKNALNLPTHADINSAQALRLTGYLKKIILKPR